MSMLVSGCPWGKKLIYEVAYDQQDDTGTQRHHFLLDL